MPDAGELLLRDFAPRSMLHLPEHRIDRAAAPVVDVHNHLGRWHRGRWTVPEVGPLLELMDACNVDTIVNLDGSPTRTGISPAMNSRRCSACSMR